MLLLFLSLVFLYDLFNCDVFEKANFNSNGPLTNEHESTRNHNFTDCSITHIMWKSTPGTDQTNPITPQYSFLATQIDHGTYLQRPTGPTPKGPPFTERFPQAIRRNQKIHQIHQGISVLEISKRRNPEAKTSSYDSVRQSREPALNRIKRSQTFSTGTKKRLSPNLLLSNGKAIRGDDTYTDDDDAFDKMITQMDSKAVLRIRKIQKITKKLWYSDQMETSEETTTKQLLRHNTVTHSYFEMIDTLQEGYMMVFLIELTRLIAAKEGKAVRDVVKHTDQIINGLYQSGQLLWFGKPLINVTRKVARLLKKSEIDVIQNHAANLHYMLSQRHQRLSEEVNTILEFADMLYDDDEGRILFDTLKEFAAYPNISLSSYWLCNNLIHNFLRPYQRLKDTQQRRELMDSVNLELKSNKKTPLQSGDLRQADDPPDENQPSLQTVPVTQTEPHNDTTQSPRKRKRKRHHRAHKRKRERKRHWQHRYRPEYSQGDHQAHFLESMTQKTRVQSRFLVKKQKP